MASRLLERARSFLANPPRPWTLFACFADFLRHVTFNIFHHLRFAHLAQQPTPNMAALRKDSTVTEHPPSCKERKMIHLKTKEECRLGNETIQVWTVELPSKHAEGILRYRLLPQPSA